MGIKVAQDRKDKHNKGRSRTVTIAMMSAKTLSDKLGRRGRDDQKIRKEVRKRGIEL